MGEQSSHTRNTQTTTSGEKEWWSSFFDDNWKRLGFDSIDAEQTSAETDFIVKSLDLKPKQKVLDQVCGVGRHCLEMARRGFENVVGLDLTQAYVKEAIVKAEHEDLAVEFVRGDMKDLPFTDESFDAVFNIFTSFGYFQDERDNQRVFNEVARVLRPGGRFLLDVVHRDYIVRHFQAKGWTEYSGEYVMEERRLDLTTSRNECTWVYVGKEGRIERPLSLRMYSLHELVGMFTRGGLEFSDAWGTWDFQPLTFDHFRQKLLAVKPK
ncbi:methyltransferase domain-containing protein [candidate division WOR-3 bacterium]|uniref:Methyltransferase domain-containing protein n=1 Tax=candidate division WOR-3 bacterium TaxID=2052148 RepID=A0A9D5QDE3_UNCW3|nr:methyltransferase domain-containing protein [candidate division WOR-3 bacterium]MBD3363960.1 methyltransferase domain-containing protein [candidate division WOR-3 bacterium]